MSLDRAKLIKFNRVLSWTLLEITVVMLGSGYAMTFIGVDVLSFRLVHFVFDFLFTSAFLTHAFISLFIVGVSRRDILNAEFDTDRTLKLTQGLSGYGVMAFGALQVLTGLDRFHLGLGALLPFTLHRVLDLYVIIFLTIHGASGAKLALMRRNATLTVSEEERIMLDRRESIRILIGAVIAVVSAFLLSKPPKVGSGQETPSGILPPGQTQVNSLRVLTEGPIPSINTNNWRFEVNGLVDTPFTLTLDEFYALPTITRITVFSCVTGWTKFNNMWEGVSYETIHEMARSKPEAMFVTFETIEGYTTSLPIIDLRKPDVLFAYRLDGSTLSRPHGGPLRLVVPEKYGYKSAKWVVKLKYTSTQELGYWESRGYSNTADPYTNDRYS